MFLLNEMVTIVNLDQHWFPKKTEEFKKKGTNTHLSSLWQSIAYLENLRWHIIAVHHKRLPPSLVQDKFQPLFNQSQTKRKAEQSLPLPAKTNTKVPPFHLFSFYF